MTLDLFKKIDDLAEEALHEKYVFLRDSIQSENERKILTDWTEGFVDRDNKIIKEFQTTFHSSFWEFYLHSLLKELNCQIDFSKDRPDFIVTSPFKFYIEAVVSNIKSGGRAEKTRNVDDVLTMIVPPNKNLEFGAELDEAIVRNSNAIVSKSKKFLEGYKQCDWVDQNAPFILALSSYNQVNYGREYFYPCMALLYGQYYIPEIDNYVFRDSVIKPGTTSKIPLGMFLNEEYNHISALVFTCTVTLGKLTSMDVSSKSETFQLNGVINIRHDYEPPHFKIQVVSQENPEYLSDGLFVFHNPNAKNKLDPTFFSNSNAVQVFFEDKGIRFEGENSPIYSRLNIPSFLITPELVNAIILDFNY
jgi:hypothetical protein